MADLEIDTVLRVATRSGTRLELTAREFNLLLFLIEHKNRIVSREMLARNVWQETSRYTPLDNVIDVQMARLRRKVDEPFATRLVHTLRGVGFILREGDE